MSDEIGVKKAAAVLYRAMLWLPLHRAKLWLSLYRAMLSAADMYDRRAHRKCIVKILYGCRGRPQ